jgi:hypothetical protein
MKLCGRAHLDLVQSAPSKTAPRAEQMLCGVEVGDQCVDPAVFDRCSYGRFLLGSASDSGAPWNRLELVWSYSQDPGVELRVDQVSVLVEEPEADRRPPLYAAGAVGGRRDRDPGLGQDRADRSTPPTPVRIDVVHDHLSRRSSSAWAKTRAWSSRSHGRSSSATPPARGPDSSDSADLGAGAAAGDSRVPRRQDRIGVDLDFVACSGRSYHAVEATLRQAQRAYVRYFGVS